MKCTEKLCGVTVALCLFLLFVLVALLLVFVYPRNSAQSVQVTTKTAGIVIGRTVLLEDTTTMIHEFHNIKYGEAPVGPLRFQPPVRRVVEEGVEVEATDDTVVSCVQADTGLGTEDCLFLTVRTANVTAKKPVLVWLHGGGLARYNGFIKGYSWDAEVTGKVDAVTVNINYRLGFLGFSSVEELWDEEAGVYANNGIRDMIAALDWIQDNIAAFGGDPTSVTIIGESGGATAVLALACSPLANNKFHAAIAQSPAPEMRFTYEEGNTYQRTIVEQAGCTQPTLVERRKCLYDLPADGFSRKYINIMSGYAYYTFPYSVGEQAEVLGLVVIDPIVVTTTPRELQNADFTPDTTLPIVISNLEQENYQLQWILEPPFTSMEDLKEQAKPLFANLGKSEDVMNQVIDLYPDLDPVSVWSLMTCDMRSTCPCNDVAREMSLASNRDIYRLYITHRCSLMIPPIHEYDAIAMFGYIIFPNLFYDIYYTFVPQEVDLKFQTHLIDMVVQLTEDKSLGDEWGVFPGKSMIYENSEEISRVTSDEPQEAVCEKLTELDLVKYGLQNK